MLDEVPDLESLRQQSCQRDSMSGMTRGEREEKKERRREEDKEGRRRGEEKRKG